MNKEKWMFILATVIIAGAMILTSCNGTNGVDDGGTDTPTVPNAPAIQQIDADNRELTVQWGAVGDADTYNLYWNTTGGVTTSDNSVTGLLTPYYVHSGLSLFKTYSYRITAVNTAGESALSNEMSQLASGIPEELWKRLASDTANEDMFGASVGMSGDYIVVGAYAEDAGGTDSGAAYIYERNYGGQDYWGEVKKLTASDAQGWDYFGNSVAIDGDYVVVGAELEDGGGNSRGAAYIFGRNYGGQDNWGEVKKLTASDAEDSDHFANSVAINGDYIVVGAFYEDDAGTDSGAAYIYERNYGGQDNWGEMKKLTASDAEADDRFGWSVAIDGDFIIIGAQYKNGGGIQRGAAYIYGRNSGGQDNWGEVKKLTASDAEDWDWYGSTVAIDGDYIVVGAHRENSTRGAAYIYDRNFGNPDNWGEVAKLAAQNSSYFGFSVAISGDYAVVGANFEDGAGTDQGAAYIYGRNSGGQDNWGEVMRLTPSDAADNDRFGCSVAVSGDYAVVGANFEDGAGTDRGAIYIF
jgi:predicted small secreted protein